MKRNSFSFSRKNFMVDPVNPTSQNNFLPSNLAPGTEDFYNSKAFMQTELQYLSTIVSMDENRALKGLNQIKDAINGLI
jgi:hypothetical protein